jgi:glycosyltransferase involved in cell wall biosynthesis
VSVIVPHYHDLRGLDRCLSAIEAQTYPRAEFEIIVADNASPEGEEAITNAIAGRARLVVITEKGAGPARNGGVSAARGELLAFTDSDCLPEPEWLSEGVAALSGHDLVGGRMKVLVDNPTKMSPEEAFESIFAFDNEAYVTRMGFTVTANLFCSPALFRHVGGFLSAGIAEDVEWSRRARAAGYRLDYAPLAIVGHPARRTWPELKHKWRRMIGDGYGLIVCGRTGRVRWLLRSLLLPVSAIAHTPRALLSSKVRGLSNHIGAVVTLHRLRWWRLIESLRLLADSKR